MLLTETEVTDTPKRRLPLFSKIAFICAGASVLLFFGFILSERFADFFNRYVSSVFRALLANITDILPFSLAEWILIMLPVALVFVLMYAFRYFSDSWHDTLIFCAAILSVFALLFSCFTLTFAAAYRGSRLDKKLGIERRDVSAEELYECALILAERVNEQSALVAFEYGGFSLMPYGYGEMNDELIEAYGKAADKYDFLQRLDSDLKPVMLSELMSYTHITGVYSFFTGEANINVAFPDYTIPYTAAHELAHQRGIAREDEANFMAFLVCLESDDPYIRYSAYLNLYEYVANALYSASPTLWSEVHSTLTASVKYEMRAYSEFYDKYRDSVAGDVSEVVNNTFLTIQGTEGTRSYGMVVDLAVAYYVPAE